MKYLFLGLLFTVRLEHLQEKTLKEHNSLGRYDQFLVSSWFSGLLFRSFCYDNLVVSVSGRRVLVPGVLVPGYPSRSNPGLVGRCRGRAGRGRCCCGCSLRPEAWRDLRAAGFKTLLYKNTLVYVCNRQ